MIYSVGLLAGRMVGTSEPLPALPWLTLDTLATKSTFIHGRTYLSAVGLSNSTQLSLVDIGPPEHIYIIDGEYQYHPFFTG